jgi:hypothetical protein
MGTIPAVRPVIEVNAVFAIAATLSFSYTPKLRLGSHNCSKQNSGDPEVAAELALHGGAKGI